MSLKKAPLVFLLLYSVCVQTIVVPAQQSGNVTSGVPADPSSTSETPIQAELEAESVILLERMFGKDIDEAADALRRGSALSEAVGSRAAERMNEDQEKRVQDRRAKKNVKVQVAPAAKPVPPVKGRSKPRGSKQSINSLPQLDWRSLVFGFQPIALSQDDKPDVKMTESDKQIKAEGSAKKAFETKDAKGTRTQKAETTYTKDGKTFGMDIKDVQVIDAVSKPDGKNFHRELSLNWGAEVAACPDANGVTTGKGMAKVTSKTIYTENGVTVTMVSEFDLQAKLTGNVNEKAEMTHYDLQLDAYATNSGYEKALEQKFIKEIKLKDGRYGLHYNIPGNTIEISDGKYGGYRKPAKMGKATANMITQMAIADANIAGSAIGPMVPSIWNSANEMYKTAERNWKNYGCVEVTCRVPKTSLKPGESIEIAAETVHLQDSTNINAQLTAEAYNGEVSPETRDGRPSATFNFTNGSEDSSSLHVESVSRRGIGRGDVEFTLAKEKDDAGVAGLWKGTLSVERTHRQEREKRSGANLAENGGYIETNTDVSLQLTGMLDRTVDATNAHIAKVSGRQELVDFEYDRYKVDEGYCGPSAVPYKGPKEITRTSTTTANYNNETKVYVEIGASGGSLSFSLPEIMGRTIHSYVHKSPCAEHDRVNTNEAVDEGVATAGGSFSVSFPMEASQKSVKGSLTVKEDDGSITTYRWELTQQGS